MIIIDQDRVSLYNFENMVSIDVVENEIYVIYDNSIREGIRIAKYKTKERAKEVLQEIAEGRYYDDTTYEMPEE